MRREFNNMHKIDSSKYIKIIGLKTLNNKLTASLDFSRNISKYFTTNCFFAEYDENIEDIDKSILSIPPLSAVITVAWATGADIYVEYLDETYLNSLKKVQSVFKEWFPQFLYKGKIYVKNIIKNKVNGKSYALLFSSGVDSLTSYIRNKDKHPILISIWGADIPLSKNEFWNNVKSRLTDFAKHEKVNIHFIKTNSRELINDHLLASKYGIKEGWWGQVCHGIMFLGVCAPLTVVNKIGTFLIASTYTKDFKMPWGSHPLIDNNISWADINVFHDGYELSRQEKIKHILKKNPKYLSFLRSCHSQHLEYNCGLCEKCLRTIDNLVLEGIDPAKCNFNIQDGIFDLIRNYFNRGLIPWGDDPFFFWQDIQNNIPDDLDENKMYNSKEFFEWFKGFDLSNYKYKGNNKLSRYLKIYYLTKYKGIGYTAKRVSKYILQKLKLIKVG